MRGIFPNITLFLHQTIILKCCHLKINFIIVAIIIGIYHSELRPTCKAYL